MILHPVGFGIVPCLLGERENRSRLILDLAHIPRATLCRQINKLINGGLINVVDQRQVWGVVEKKLSLHNTIAIFLAMILVHTVFNVMATRLLKKSIIATELVSALFGSVVFIVGLIITWYRGGGK